MQIVDENGKSVSLRAVNLGGWLVWEGWIFGKGTLTEQPQISERLENAVGADQFNQFRTSIYDRFITEKDIQRIAQSGFNCVRVPLDYQMFETQSGWNLLDRLLLWCEKNRLWVILDMHNVPGNSIVFRDTEHSIWTSNETQSKVVSVWKEIATHCRNSRIVAGYDLLNEPVPKSGDQLISIYQRIIAAIRQIDSNHLLMLEGGKFATDFSMFDRPLDDNQAYSFHMYTWFGDNRQESLAGYVSFARRQNAPLWNGEFGENTYQMIGSTVDMFEQHPEIRGWAFWTWKKAGGLTYPGLVTINLSPNWKLVIDWLARFVNIRQPAKATIQQGMSEFTESIELPNCNFDQRMADALFQPAKERSVR